MTTYDTICKLCEQKGIAVTALESALGFGRGSIGKLKTGGDITATRLKLIARYFDVSVDYLMNGESKQPEQIQKDIGNDLNDAIAKLANDSSLLFNGERLDEETRRLLKISLETSLENAKIIANAKKIKKD